MWKNIWKHTQNIWTKPQNTKLQRKSYQAFLTLKNRPNQSPSLYNTDNNVLLKWDNIPFIGIFLGMVVTRLDDKIPAQFSFGSSKTSDITPFYLVRELWSCSNFPVKIYFIRVYIQINMFYLITSCTRDLVRVGDFIWILIIVIGTVTRHRQTLKNVF